MKVVIVGGGFGGVKTALGLMNKPGISVTLVTQHANFEYHGALYRSATGHSPKEVVIPLHEIFEGAKNIKVVLDTATRIDAENRCVHGELGEQYEYDFAVLALGNQINYFGIKGMEENALHMDTIAATLALRERLIDLCTNGKKTVKIVVIGAGPSGVELSGEVGHFAERIAQRHARSLPKLQVTLVEGADRVLPTLSEVASRKSARRLRKLGVKLKLNTRVDSCEPGKVCVSGADLKADLIVWTAGSSPSSFLSKNGDVFQLDRGRAKVDSHLRAVGQPHIYVLGDNAATPYAGMAQTALHNAIYVANDILANQHQKRHMDYKPKPPIYVVPIGPRWAVFQSGKKVRSGAFGWAVRRKADMEIFRSFEPYAKAIQLWRAGNEMSDF